MSEFVCIDCGWTVVSFVERPPGAAPVCAVCDFVRSLPEADREAARTLVRAHAQPVQRG